MPVSTEGGGKQSGSQTDDGQSAQDTWRESVNVGSEDPVPCEKELELLSDFEDMWSGRLGNISAAKHRIDLTPDAKPVYQVLYRAGHRAREIEKRERPHGTGKSRRESRV